MPPYPGVLGSGPSSGAPIGASESVLPRSRLVRPFLSDAGQTLLSPIRHFLSGARSLIYEADKAAVKKIRSLARSGWSPRNDLQAMRMSCDKRHAGPANTGYSVRRTGGGGRATAGDEEREGTHRPAAVSAPVSSGTRRL